MRVIGAGFMKILRLVLFCLLMTVPVAPAETTKTAPAKSETSGEAKPAHTPDASDLAKRAAESLTKNIDSEALSFAGETMSGYRDSLSNKLGINTNLALAILVLCGTTALIALAILANRIVRAAAHRVVDVIAKNSAFAWLLILKEERVFIRLSMFASALVFTRLGYFVYILTPGLNEFVGILVSLYVILVTFGIIDALLNAVHEICKRRGLASNLPIRGIFQAVKLVMLCCGLILALAILLGQNPAQMLAGLGAMMAVLMFAFKDPIMGLVGGITLAANRLVLVGDWIEMPKYGADGDVIDISLTTVKVRNWDMTTVNIPPYALISDSFKNWRGMTEAGGRRVKRTINIDTQTIRFATPEMLRRWEKIALISDYIKSKDAELTEANKHLSDSSVPANARLLTNIGTFRVYCLAYLHAHAKVHQQMTVLVRQLQADEYGLPIELYFFTNDIGWAAYEGIQSDIFDHLFAIVGEFDLAVYQRPSSRDQRFFNAELAAKK